MFTGRRFDIETGLYYYRARYYNPHIGRFVQTDPVGYGAGINWYLYCGNNPLGRTDPSGLGWVNGVFEVKIAFYDGSDPGGPTIATMDGDDFLECVDDFYFDIAIDIRQGETWGYGQNGQPGRFGDLTDFVIRELGHPEDWSGRTGYIEYLMENPGDYSKLEITDVYIFDHGHEDADKIQIGDHWLISQSDALAAFCAGIQGALTTTGPDAVINFRNCHTADADATGNRPFLKELARLTGHTVTGVDGRLGIRQKADGTPIPRWFVPDYFYEFGLYQATPGGTVTTLWKNELRTATNVFYSWAYNPWGSQPY